MGVDDPIKHQTFLHSLSLLLSPDLGPWRLKWNMQQSCFT